MESGNATIAGVLDCGCWIGPWWGVTPPPQCAEHGGVRAPPPQPFPTHDAPPAHVIDYGQYEPTKNGSPTVAIVATLTNQDVERIARRVVELLMKTPLPTGQLK